MSSSPTNFSFDNWDAVLAPVLPSSTEAAAAPSPSFSMLSSTASSPSGGEFQPYTLIGSALSGGGGKKSFFLFSETTKSPSYCMGMIGRSKFCLKMRGEKGKEDQVDACVVQAHETNKFQPEPGSFYLKENETRAFIQPVLMKQGLTLAAVEAILKRSFTLKEWQAIFSDLGNDEVPEWLRESLQVDTANAKEPGCADLASPRLVVETSDVLITVPTLSFEDESVASESLDLDQAAGWIKEFQRRFARLKPKWRQAFTDVEANHVLLVKDLQTLHTTVATLTTQVGSVPMGEFVGFGSTLWSALGNMARTLTDHTSTLASTAMSLQDIRQNSIEMMEEQEADKGRTEGRFETIERCLQVFESRFAKILPILRSVSLPTTSPKDNSFKDYEILQKQVAQLTTTVESLQTILWDSGSLPSSAPKHDGERLLLEIQAQLKQLQHQVVGGGVRIGAKIFQSFDVVEVWVKTELPTQRYGLFVDAVSLLDFFSCVGHVDADKTFAAFHSQQKTGFSSMYEARVAASVQNTFPMVFGRSPTTGIDDSEYIPAITDPDKWDNGITGIKHQILRGMSDVEYQLESAIDSILNPYAEARQVAKECLYRSKRFVVDLCNFISTDYQKWKLRGHGKRDSWRMTAVSVRRIFEEIHSERVVARDIYDFKDSAFSSAKFLWATWKAHQVMEKYIKHQFYEHPSIAAVLARHLADNYIKPDDTLANKLSTLDKAHTALLKRVDGMTTKENETKAERSESKAEKSEKKQSKNDKGRGPQTTPP
jgi:hypothetical protein